MKFKNEQFNELCEFMEKMDSSDDYIMVQVSALNPGKAGMEMTVAVTGREGGKEQVGTIAAEVVLIMAMLRNKYLKRLITNAAERCEQYEAIMRRRKS